MIQSHGLTKRQKQALKFIMTYRDRHDDISPTYAEIRDGLGLASKSGIHRLITALEERKLILRGGKNRARCISIVMQKCPHCGWEFL